MEFPYQSRPKPPAKEAVTTVDDCLKQAEALANQLRRLARQKHPLDIRKGTSLKSGDLEQKSASKVLKAGRKTYFFDVKWDKENRPYLVITESRFQGEGKERARTRLTVFSEHASDFHACVTELIEKL